MPCEEWKERRFSRFIHGAPALLPRSRARDAAWSAGRLEWGLARTLALPFEEGYGGGTPASSVGGARNVTKT